MHNVVEAKDGLIDAVRKLQSDLARMFGDELDRFERSASIDGISNNDESEEEVAIAQLGGKLWGGYQADSGGIKEGITKDNRAEKHRKGI